MKLILLYGPPAVGKLAVASALQKLTNFRIIHNHLISDIALSIFNRNTPEAADLNHQIRCLLYEFAAKNSLPGIISTVLYRYDIKDQAHAAILDYVNILHKTGGEVCAVRLSCDTQVLLERVVSPSRIGTKKISSTEKLLEVLRKEDLMRELPKTITTSLHIDNTHLQPEEVARQIQIHFHL